MKINNSIKNTATTSATDVKQKQTGKAGGSAGSSAASGTSASGSSSAATNVSLSTQLQNVMEQTGDTAVFDTKKVDEIKAAISGGQFKVDSGIVADKLIKTVSELLQKPKE